MNEIDLNCPYEQTYNVVICHNKEGLDFSKTRFGDYSNKLYLSDTGVEGTIDVSNGYPSSLYGELPFYSWIAQNLRPKDWVRVNHYRRKCNQSIGLSLPAPIEFKGSLAQQMAYYHSPVLVDAMMKTLNPVEQQIMMTSNQLLPYNIMYAPVGFIQNTYLPWMMDKITALRMVLGPDFKPDASFFEPREGKRIDDWYQNRVYAFAMERYTTVFFFTHNLGQNFVQVKLLEEGQKV
jgi:hypothetical protein